MSTASPQLCPHQRNAQPAEHSLIASPQSISKISEDHVAALLRERGWLILGRNFRTTGTELDIVARKKSIVAVFEVKARRRLPSQLSELLPFKKQIALERGARRFLASRRIFCVGVRFDLVIVLLSKAGEIIGIRYFPSVFEAKKL